MKRIKRILLAFALLFIPLHVSAASGSISVSGTSTVVLGNKVTVTVTLSSSSLIGSWQMDLNYDRSVLQLTSSNAEGGGTRMVNSSNTGVKKKSYTFTFKTLKTGNTKLNVDSYLAYDFNDFSSLSLSSNAKTVKIITQAELEASYSKNNNLKSLEVEGFELSPAFNKDTLEYSAVVPENTKEINIKAQAEDGKSSINGTGTHEVSLGSNTFSIVVRAENGAEKTYTINVEVKDANPIAVKINDNEFTVVKIKESLPLVSLYNDYTVKINDFDIPAYKNENTNIVLVGLKNSNGEVSLYIYDEKTQEYKAYYEVGTNKITIYPLPLNDEISGYQKDTIEINKEKVEAYVYKKDSNFAIIYGMNLESGEKAYFMYDKKNQTISIYNDEYITDLNEKIQTYTYIIFGFSTILVIMFIILIIIITKKSKKKPKKITSVPQAKEENQDAKNEIIEIKENLNSKKSKNNKKKRNA